MRYVKNTVNQSCIQHLFKNLRYVVARCYRFAVRLADLIIGKTFMTDYRKPHGRKQTELYKRIFHFLSPFFCFWFMILNF